MNRKKGEYGLGRDRLPKQLAVPLAEISKKIGAKPVRSLLLVVQRANEGAKNASLYTHHLIIPKILYSHPKTMF
jgi:hypothetical protein